MASSAELTTNVALRVKNVALDGSAALSSHLEQTLFDLNDHTPPRTHFTSASLSVFSLAMFVAAAAAVPRSISRLALSNGSKSLAGRPQAKAAAARGFSSVFQPTPAVRKSAAVESLDDDDWDDDVPPASKINPACIVNSHTEWDPLEEVIVGRVDDATIPEWHVSGKAVWPAKHWDMYKNHVGESFPKELVNKGTGSPCVWHFTCVTTATTLCRVF